MVDYSYIASEIKDLVPMPDFCRINGVSVNQAGFAKCIFHADSKPSMKIYPGNRGFHCFACGVGGDVIKYAQQYYSTDFVGSLEMMIRDFSLPFSLEEKKDDENYRKQKERIEARKRQIEAEEKEKARREQDFIMKQSIFVMYDKWKREYEPLWMDEEPDPRFIEAVKNIDSAYENMMGAMSLLT